jgi:hypothetical protein
MFIFDILSGRMNSPNLLYALDLDSGFRVSSNWFPLLELWGS